MMYSIVQLQDYANFLRDCDFLGQRGSALAAELASLLEEHIQCNLSLDGLPYIPEYLLFEE